ATTRGPSWTGSGTNRRKFLALADSTSNVADLSTSLASACEPPPMRIQFQPMNTRCLLRKLALLLILTATVPLTGQSLDQGKGRGQVTQAQAGLPEIDAYISTAWDTLTRSMTSCKSISDPKASTRPVIYLPADWVTPATLDHLPRECQAQIVHLPRVVHRLGEFDGKKLDPHALLYLPHPYIVPGGMFNEMYGWDSYFIIRGLLESGRIDMARGMVEN